MKFEIKHRWSGVILFSLECESLKLCVSAAVGSGADLCDANLRGADLRGADLRGADLCDADLRGADLRGADLGGADLRGANLGGADLRGADLCDADLGGADLRGANLRGANLRGANLREFRDDLWAVLSAAPKEVSGLRAAIAEGRIDGSTYSGECACLVGTIANIRGVNENALGILKPNSSRPIETFFMAIKKGDMPDTNQASALALEWTDMWLANMRDAFGALA
jgi:uncharacterized protein YjbI with pentapeptide repeats